MSKQTIPIIMVDVPKCYISSSDDSEKASERWKTVRYLVPDPVVNIYKGE